MADYPAWRYHATQPARIVESVEEDLKLGQGWFNNPKLESPAKAEPPAKPEPEEVKTKPVVTAKGKGK